MDGLGRIWTAAEQLEICSPCCRRRWHPCRITVIIEIIQTTAWKRRNMKKLTYKHQSGWDPLFWLLFSSSQSGAAHRATASMPRTAWDADAWGDPRCGPLPRPPLPHSPRSLSLLHQWAERKEEGVVCSLFFPPRSLLSSPSLSLSLPLAGDAHCPAVLPLLSTPSRHLSLSAL